MTKTLKKSGESSTATLEISPSKAVQLLPTAQLDDYLKLASRQNRRLRFAKLKIANQRLMR
jgi:hypothetical protein